MSLPFGLVPTLQPDQIQFGYGSGSVLMGPNTPFGLKKIEGLDKADVRSGNTDRPRTRGSFIGLNLLKSRTITVTMDVGPMAPGFGSYSTLAGALAALRTQFNTEGTTEYPLWLQLPGQPLVGINARVTKTSFPWDITADLGQMLQNALVQFECTDPYFYTPVTATTILLPTPAGGFAFPLSFNLSFGGGSSANQATVTNLGDAPCWPVMSIYGPCLNPTITNTTISGSPTLSLGIQLNGGDTLTIDCDMQTIVYTPNGQTVGSPYPQILQPGSSFFSLMSGPNVLSFNSQDVSQVSGEVIVSWSSAYSALIA